MLTAIGRAVVRNPDGTSFGVTVDVRDDVTGKTLATYVFTATSQADLKAQVDAQLASMKAAITDATLNTAIVGKTISSV